MHCSNLSLEDTHQFSTTFLAYIHQNPELKEFYDQAPNLDGFKNQIEAKHKNFPKSNREILTQALLEQYKHLSIESTSLVHENIKALSKEDSFTVTTGHQLCLFTGPLYFIYKIITTIRLAQTLKEQFPDKNFIPVYWMASEDHDFEEINHFFLFGKKYIWESNDRGAVGRRDLKGLEKVFEELPQKIPLLENAYLNTPNLSVATLHLVHTLFQEWGLVCLDADHKLLKETFSPIIEKEIIEPSSFDLMQTTTAAFEAKGFEGQITGRPINFFYLDQDLRERIILEDQSYKVLNTDISWNTEEIKNEIQTNPQKFSPNVVLRPLYQEWILPNLAYIGGPSEIVYWLQLKSIFDFYKTDFPILVPRNFALIITKANYQKVEKLKLELKDLFLAEGALKKVWLQKQDNTLEDYKNEYTLADQLFDLIQKKIEQVDKSLIDWAASEKQKLIKSLDNIEKRMNKAVEKKNEIEINQLQALKQKLFPNGSPQERHDNFLNFFLNKQDFIQDVYQHFDPLDFKMNILIEP